MTNSNTNPKVDNFIDHATKWQEAFIKLRSIVLESELTEDLKWGVPCYTYKNKNVVLIHGFKEYCAILFIKGALLKDTDKILIQQTENVQAGRQIRFAGIQEIIALEKTITAYINEAIEIEKSGAGVALKKSTAFKIPEELQTAFEENQALKTAFEALTPGRQRAYILHFSEPKQSKTRVSRIEKCTAQILIGKGLND